jgi:hypothetical protein
VHAIINQQRPFPGKKVKIFFVGNNYILFVPFLYVKGLKNKYSVLTSDLNSSKKFLRREKFQNNFKNVLNIANERFDELKERKTAEYYSIGAPSSISHALGNCILLHLFLREGIT